MSDVGLSPVLRPVRDTGCTASHFTRVIPAYCVLSQSPINIEPSCYHNCHDKILHNIPRRYDAAQATNDVYVIIFN